MNSYERIMTAMKFQEPDRVPLAEFVIHKRIIAALMPEAREQADFEEKFDFDVVSARAWYRTEWEKGNTFMDEWGIIYGKNDETVAHPLEGPLKSPADLKNLVLPDPDLPARLGNLPELVGRFKGERAVSFGMRAMFLWAANLTGLDNLLMYLLTEPEFVHELLDRILESSIKMAKNAVRGGADIILETDDYAYNKGPLMSPATFAEFIGPRMKRFAAAVHAEGGYLLKHTDGNIMKIIDTMVAAGIDGLQSIDPLAGMDIGEVKRKYGDRISLWGNIDCGNLLGFGNEKDVEEAVKECIRQAAPGGGFVLTSSNCIPFAAKPENYLAMLRSARLYGKYPISI